MPAKAGFVSARFSICPIPAIGPSSSRWPAAFYEIVLEAGGTISSAQGCGLARTQFLRKQYGELVQVFREIKDAFDPLDQLNPGKVIGDDPHLMIRDLVAHGPRQPRRARAGALVGRDRLLEQRRSAGRGRVREPAASSRRRTSTASAPEHADAGRQRRSIQPALRWPAA